MPIVPPAPVRFSITIWWPIARDTDSPTTRATKIQSASGRKRHDEAHRPIGPRGLGRALRACRVRTMRRLGDTAEQRDAPCCPASDKRPPLDLGQFFLP